MKEKEDLKWKEIIEAVDANGDGKVSYQEFEDALLKFTDF